MTTQNCNKCGCPVAWDKLIDKKYTKKDGKEVIGWWREDLSKEIHSKERCENFTKTGDFSKVSSSKTGVDNPQEKTIWPTAPAQYTPDQRNLMDAEEIYCKMAYDVVRGRHPNMDENSNIFGQIVNAVEGHLIQCGKIKAIRELRSEKDE